MKDKDGLIQDFRQEARQLAASKPSDLEKELKSLEDNKVEQSNLEGVDRADARKAMREYWQHIMELWDKDKRAA